MIKYMKYCYYSCPQSGAQLKARNKINLQFWDKIWCDFNDCFPKGDRKILFVAVFIQPVADRLSGNILAFGRNLPENPGNLPKNPENFLILPKRLPLLHGS